MDRELQIIEQILEQITNASDSTEQLIRQIRLGHITTPTAEQSEKTKGHYSTMFLFFVVNDN